MLVLEYLVLGSFYHTPSKKRGYGTHLYLNRQFIMVLILSVDLILKVFGYRLNRYYI